MLIHAAITFVTNGWEQSETASFGQAAFDATCICQKFQDPLEAASLDCSAVQEERVDTVKEESN